MNKKELIKKLEKWTEFKMIKIADSRDERLVFNSQEVFDTFGKEGILDPFNDYTYDWLHTFFEDLKSYLTHEQEGEEDLNFIMEEFRDTISELADSTVSVYTSDLTKWLASNNDNATLLDEVVSEGNQENILMMAQYKAIEELFHNAHNKILEVRKMNNKVIYEALATKVIAVAVITIRPDGEIFEWAVYVDSVQGIDHELEYQRVADVGDKVSERIAIAIFPQYEKQKYRR